MDVMKSMNSEGSRYFAELQLQLQNVVISSVWLKSG